MTWRYKDLLIDDEIYPKNPWDVGRGVKLPSLLRPFRGVIRRVWCFNNKGQDC